MQLVTIINVPAEGESRPNHLNQALHQLLMALEGGGHHGKKHHNHGHGLGMVGAKGGNSSGVSADAGNGSGSGKQTRKSSGRQGAFPAFSGLLNIFLSPGSRLFLVQNSAAPPGKTGAFAKGLKQTASQPARRGTSALAANKQTEGTGAFGRGAGLLAGMSGGGLVNIQGNNNTVTINLNAGKKQNPNANPGPGNLPAKTAKSTNAATVKQAAKTIGTPAGTTASAKTGKGLTQKAKVEPKTNLAVATRNNLVAGKKAASKPGSARNQATGTGRSNFGPGNIGAAGHRSTGRTPAMTVAKAPAAQKRGR
jgi:hypothetical protein